MTASVRANIEQRTSVTNYNIVLSRNEFSFKLQIHLIIVIKYVTSLI